MRIAIVGSGISGLVCARLLARVHDVTVYEANSHVGGHTNTVDVNLHDEHHRIDTGFIVYNDRTYPHFSRLLHDLQVESSPTSMSFSVRCERSGLEYNGTSLNGVFAQRMNLFRPRFLRLLRDILKFNSRGKTDWKTVSATRTVQDYLDEHRLSKQFAGQYLYPMGAAIWSCPVQDFAHFPIRFILEFYWNHGLLSLRDRPVWRVVKGGSAEYIKPLIQPFADRIRLNCPVVAVQRGDNRVHIRHAQGSEDFDEVVLACHSDQALKMLSDADASESEVLSAFPYSSNSAVLHTDDSVLPRKRRAWASWNYHIPQGDSSRPTVTYNMNILQGIQSEHTFCVTLNEDERIDSSRILGRFKYSHPVFTPQREEFQQRHGQFIRRRKTSFCGAYWRNGFHEDGVVSALNVCRSFGLTGFDPSGASQVDAAIPEISVSECDP